MKGRYFDELIYHKNYWCTKCGALKITRENALGVVQYTSFRKRSVA